MSEKKTDTTSATALPVARAFFSLLENEQVRFGAFKSTATVIDAVAGRQDMDLIVARSDYGRFCSLAAGMGGIRGVAHPSLVSLGREDWFLPDLANGRYLHLDVHVEVRLGGKFNKHYPAFGYGDVAQWDHYEGEGFRVPISSPQDEAAITLCRIAFRHAAPQWLGEWTTISGDWERELKALLFAGLDAEKTIPIHAIAGGKSSRCRLHNGHVQVHAGDLGAIRHGVRRMAGESILSVPQHWLFNRYRQARYFAARLWTRAFPGSVLDRRRPASGGLVVALIAPDGLGKSSQVERLYRIFKWKFCAGRVYLGTGDGDGWLVRRLIVKFYKGRRDRIRSAMQLDGDASSSTELSARGTSPSLRQRLGATAMSIHGWIAARERYTKLGQARRMANRGYIVLADRWPQDMQHGYMDGPIRLDEANLFPVLRFIRRHELKLFERMRKFQPDISIHMVADHSVSAARKPGEISQEAFDMRIALMARMREAAPDCVVVDASQSIDKVTSDLLSNIWRIL